MSDFDPFKLLQAISSPEAARTALNEASRHATLRAMMQCNVTVDAAIIMVRELFTTSLEQAPQFVTEDPTQATVTGWIEEGFDQARTMVAGAIQMAKVEETGSPVPLPLDRDMMQRGIDQANKIAKMFGFDV